MNSSNFFSAVRCQQRTQEDTHWNCSNHDAVQQSRQNFFFFSLRVCHQWMEQATTRSRRRTVSQHVQEQAGQTLDRYGRFSADWLYSTSTPCTSTSNTRFISASVAKRVTKRKATDVKVKLLPEQEHVCISASDRDEMMTEVYDDDTHTHTHTHTHRL